LPIISGKLGLHQGSILEDATFEVLRQEKAELDFTRAIENLPYVFKDPVAFDKKVDPRKLTFGSRIDNSRVEVHAYYTVREVTSPEKLILNSGIRIRLLGVRQVQGKDGEAVQFLRQKTKGQRVFLKFDAVKHDEEDNLLCYLYLKNKTFLNAHLIKNGLAQVDTKLDYKYKSKFLSLQGTKPQEIR
jgi:site-specific DNA-methyltransferase (adenine-specific)